MAENVWRFIMSGVRARERCDRHAALGHDRGERGSGVATRAREEPEGASTQSRRTAEDAELMINAGAARIGTSFAVDIIKEFSAEKD